ncbi:microfibrillar-associated protein, putative [Theileria annulata]|uniref:Microfibrillar-associated protein, putative n=1 Tax=Theileria annulata TaxID=5874 RepID=Q4U9V1_THEAN|nr:microfibrillar-associated protein, putative [Theileria annulata]CAI76402.1 microfibrillar-associated protein, putative [Theileria annulata]|eukprot:XP_953027.1 microfibrillar-associated protein, putative [Theileria annulata]
MSALELFKILGDESNKPPPTPKHILKKRIHSQPEKAKRYWPGKAPDFALEEDSLSDDSSHEEEPQILADKEPDRRLNRYKITEIEGSQDVSDRIRRRKAQVETITVYESTHPKDDKQDDKLTTPVPDGYTQPAEKKLDRSTLRKLALEYRKKEEESAPKTVEEEPEESESDTSEESDYQEDEAGVEDLDVLSKPVFVPKGSRKTESEKEQLRKEEVLRKENEKKRLMERKRDTKEMVIQKVQELEEEPEPEDELIDDTDTFDEKEYELWKIRELKRILRDKEEREKFKKLEEEVKLRRSMTDEERELDNQKVDKVVVEKSKLRFLQKYYHRGAFFMDKLQDKSEPLYARDFNAPTAEDCVDKSLLPKPMRVRRGLYGKQGQVKHTHLKDVDTTQFDAWSKTDKYKLTGLFSVIITQFSGTKQVFDRPSRKK